jgi:hypothetical protein
MPMPAPLTNPEAKSDLTRWDVPFAIWRYPSVHAITESDNSNVILVVRPDGFGRYPQYLVRFSNVVVLLRYDSDEIPQAFTEVQCSIERGWHSLVRSEPDLCAYRWVSSPWVRNCSGLELTSFKDSGQKLHHYILIGENDTVEVVALGEPAVERVDKEMVIEVKHEV